MTATEQSRELGRQMAERFLARPGLPAMIERLVREGVEDGRRRGVLYYPGATAELQALQLFDHAVGVPPGTVHAREEYWHAAHLVQKAGHPECWPVIRRFGELTDNMHTLGESWSHPFDQDVEPYHREWAERHDRLARPADPGPPAGLVRERGRPRLGADGATYTPAICDGLPGGMRPAVVVRASTAQAETVVFPSVSQAREWLASRRVGGTGPLATTADGPPCRAACEDEVIAHLLQHPEDTHVCDLVNENTWTSHLRARMFRATRPVGGDVRRLADMRMTMEHWLLRSPGWALPMIGWPNAHRAMGYFGRLLATPVTRTQAIAAAHVLERKPEPASLASAPAPVALASELAARAIPAQARRAPASLERPPALPDAAPATPRLLSERTFVPVPGRTP